MNLNRVTFAAGGFLGLHVLLTYWRPFPFWGADHLAYYDVLSRAAFLVASVVLLFRQSREFLIVGLRGLWVYLSHSSYGKWVAHLGLVAVGTGLFIYFKASTPLLGDGQLYLTELETVSGWDRADNAPLSFWLLRYLHSLGASPNLTFQIYSYAGGVLFLILSVPAARTIGESRVSRFVVLGFLLTGGFLQLFFGYVENYAILLPAVLFFVLCCCRCLEGRLPLWVAAGVLGCIIPLHFSLGSFAPCLLVLAWLTSRRMGWRAWAGLVAVPVCALVVITLIGFDLVAYMSRSKGVHFLPLLSGADTLYPHTMFSGMHFLNFANQQILAAPAAVIALLAFSRKGSSRNQLTIFLTTSAAFPLLFTLILNPEIGAFRDWDTMAVPAMPLTIWAAHWICRQAGASERLQHVALMLCGASLLHTVFWIGTNSEEAKSVSRFLDLLQQGRLSAPARAYGWETLGTFQRKSNRRGEAIMAYQNAIEAHPGNPRYWSMLGALLRDGGQTEMSTLAYGKAKELGSVDPYVYNLLGNESLGRGDRADAITHYNRALGLDPNFAEAYFNLGNVYLEEGEEDFALQQYGNAIRIRPGFAEAYYNAGNIHLKRRSFGKAMSAYELALVANPEFAQAHYNMGNAALSLGKLDVAIEQYLKTLAVDPRHANANFSLGRIYQAAEQLDEAKRHYAQALALDPGHPAADSMKAWLSEYQLNLKTSGVQSSTDGEP